ncbi:unnamed protein product [Withania somnifera]
MKGSINSSSSGMLVDKREYDVSNPTITIKVSYASQDFDLPVPAEFTFGEVKGTLSSIIGLEPKMQKLLFRGKEKEDNEYLHLAGVKENSKLLVMEEETVEEKIPEEVRVTTEISRGAEAVAEVRTEVDKLSEQVSAIQAVVFGGNNVEDKDIICLTEMLMRQLLKLDGIEAEREGRVQRKMEVRRVQSLVETMDAVKARNSNPFSNNSNAVSVTTEWETFDSEVGSLNVPPPRNPALEVGSLNAPPPHRPALGVGSLNAPPPGPASVVGNVNAPPHGPAFGVGSLNLPPPRPVSGVGSLDASPCRPASGVGKMNAPPPGLASEVGSLNSPPPRPAPRVGSLNASPPPILAPGVGSMVPSPPRPVSGVGSLNASPPRPASGIGSMNALAPPTPVLGVGSLNAPPPGPAPGVGSLNTHPLRPPCTVVTQDWEQFE